MPKIAIEFKNNKLYLFQQEILVLKANPLRAWHKSLFWGSGNWVASFPRLREGFLSIIRMFVTGRSPKNRNQEKAFAFLSLCELSHLKIMIACTAGHFQVLRVLQRYPELAQRPPAFIFIIAFAYTFMGKPRCKQIRLEKKLLRMSNQNLAAIVNLPHTKSVVRLLAKIKKPGFEIFTLLRRIYNHENLEISKFLIKRMAHFQAPITPEVVEAMTLLQTHPRLLTNQFLIQLGNSCNRQQDWSREMRDTLNMQISLTGKAPVHIDSLSELSRLHCELVQAINSKEIKQSLPLPEYPYQTPCKQITTTDALWLAGRKFHNCLGSFEKKCLKGFAYVFEFQEWVFSVEYTTHKVWIIAEIRGKCNQQPPTYVADAIKALFTPHLSLLPPPAPKDNTLVDDNEGGLIDPGLMF